MKETHTKEEFVFVLRYTVLFVSLVLDKNTFDNVSCLMHMICSRWYDKIGCVQTGRFLNW